MHIVHESIASLSLSIPNLVKMHPFSRIDTEGVHNPNFLTQDCQDKFYDSSGAQLVSIGLVVV
jgi:hypothetical protein